MTQRVCMVRAYYNNPQMLQLHIDLWNDLPSSMAANLSAIVVDDCSGRHPAEPIIRRNRCQIPIRLFRMEVDVRWNWLGARNVGMHHAPEGWCFITDMDHTPQRNTLLHMLAGEFDPETVYRFNRIGWRGDTLQPHPNSWFMTRAMFWKIGGFNEAASGFYGTDGHYRKRVAATAPVVIMEQPLIRWEGYLDAMTDDYKRKQPEDARGKQILRKWGSKPPRVLSFPYHEVHLGQEQASAEA